MHVSSKIVLLNCARRGPQVCGYIAEPAHGGRPARLHVRRGYGCTGCWRAYVV
jgi:hypothetical protein